MRFRWTVAARGAEDHRVFSRDRNGGQGAGCRGGADRIPRLTCRSRQFDEERA